jgi:membrane-associated phospholipid phosphatase
MDILADFSLDVTVWLQENYPQLEDFLTYFSYLGLIEFYLIVITLIYWSLNKQLGRTLAYVSVLSFAFNSMVKHFFADLRPYWINPNVQIATEESFGLPSGHAQGATVLYGLLAMWIKKGWVWFLAIALIMIMAISRVYLGVHDIEDVVGGVLIGIIVLVGYAVWQKYIAPIFSNRILGQRLLVAIIVPLFLAAIYAGIIFLLGQPEERSAPADLIETAHVKGFKDAATSFGLLVGLGSGFVMESSRVRFKVDGPLWKRVLRYLLGLIVTVLIWSSRSYLIPEEPLAILIVGRVSLGIIGGTWVSYYAPWVFVRLKLAESKPKPEISISF